MSRQPRIAVRRRWFLPLAGAIGLCACSSGLSSLDKRTVDIGFGQNALDISIGYNIGEGDDVRCVTLRDFSGSLNGMPLQVVSSGRAAPHSGPELRCELPRLKLTAEQFPASSEANIRISDDTMEIKIDLPTFFAPRTTAVASQTPGQMHPGEEVVLSWTPESDSVPDGYPSCSFRSDTRGEVFRSSPFLTPQSCVEYTCDNHIALIDPQHVWLQVPMPAVSQGPLPISGTLLLGSLSRAIDRCEGAICIVAAAVHVTQITMVAAPNP